MHWGHHLLGNRPPNRTSCVSSEREHFGFRKFWRHVHRVFSRLCMVHTTKCQNDNRDWKLTQKPTNIIKFDYLANRTGTSRYPWDEMVYCSILVFYQCKWNSLNVQVLLYETVHMISAILIATGCAHSLHLYRKWTMRWSK